MAFQVTESEITARKLLDRLDVAKADSYQMIVAGVFASQWASSLTLAQVERIGGGLSGFTGLDILALARALKSLSRLGILRSRIFQGARRWELAI